MEPVALVLSVISIANIGVLAVLIAIFGGLYARTRAQLPLGMAVVAAMLVLHNALGAAAYFSHDVIFFHAIFPYLLGVGVAELAGLLVLLKITLD